MKPTYRIRDWNDHFENNESRKLKKLAYVLTPNKQDGKGYRRVTAHPRAAEILGAWAVITQVASKMPERGTLADEDGPLDAEDLHFITGLPVDVFEMSLGVLCAPGINWLIIAWPGESPGTSRNIPDPPETSGDAGNPILEQNRTEQNRTEGEINGAENPPDDISPAKPSNRFTPPTVEEVAAYCRERRNQVNPQTFVDFYESKGWLVGKNRMKDWQAAVRTWEQNSRASPATTKPQQPSGIKQLQEMRKAQQAQPEIIDAGFRRLPAGDGKT